MAVQVVPSQKKDPLQTLLPIGGAVAGGVFGGGPAGAAAGAAAGAGVGSTAAGLLQKPPSMGVQTTQNSETSGMQRRMENLNNDPVLAIAQARAAVSGLPPDQFPETRRAFEQAIAIAQRNQELGRQGVV